MARPVYPGGRKAMGSFIAAQLRYPPEAWQARVGGTVVVRLSINYHGQVIKTEVLQGIGYGCDEEAARVSALLQFKVQRPRQLKVIFFRTINIHFHAPSPAPQITYELTPSTPERTTSANISYTITITSGEKKSK